MKSGPVQPASSDEAARQEPLVKTMELSVPCDIRRGGECPICAQGRMDYNGLLNLACPSCGFTLSGSFT